MRAAGTPGVGFALPLLVGVLIVAGVTGGGYVVGLATSHDDADGDRARAEARREARAASIDEAREEGETRGFARGMRAGRARGRRVGRSRGTRAAGGRQDARAPPSVR